MASAPQNSGLPLFYSDLVPINTDIHANFKTRMTNKAKWMASNHVVPLTVEEFPLTQRNLPIVFSAGDDPIPLAMFGLNEGVNVFVDEDGTVDPAIYVPAYVRRYPFLLARLSSDATNCRFASTRRPTWSANSTKARRSSRTVRLAR